MLADAFKRIGLAERTGRGVDLIYQGLLRYGRPAPSYARSDRSSVIVELDCTDADLSFLRLVLEQEQRVGAALPVDTLLILSQLRAVRRLDGQEIACLIQKDSAAARAVIERLVERAILQPKGQGKGTIYKSGRKL